MPKAVRKSIRGATRNNVSTETGKRMPTRARAKAPIYLPAKSVRTPRPKKVVLPFLARSLEEVEVDTNRATRLFALPKEIILEIASYLPLPSVLCLTVTCKLAVDVLGTQTWIDYKKGLRMAENSDGITEQEAFYNLILRDWGHLVEYCPTCGTLHTPLRPPKDHRKTRLTTTCFGPNAMVDYLPQDETHGYSLVLQHVITALELSQDYASKGASGQPIDLLSGNFTVRKGSMSWSLASSGQRVDGNLVVKHVHTFRSASKGPLRATDIQALPVRLCPHQSTTTTKAVPSRYIKTNSPAGALLIHAITNAFPKARQGGIDMSVYKAPTPSEQQQISAAAAGEEVYWQCRSCPTQYRVEYALDTLAITAWHSFGRDLHHASKYWKWIVRREGYSLGPDKRNDEWWSPSRTIPEFQRE